jgi:hypothetical protein
MKMSQMVNLMRVHGLASVRFKFSIYTISNEFQNLPADKKLRIDYRCGSKYELAGGTLSSHLTRSIIRGSKGNCHKTSFQASKPLNSRDIFESRNSA